MKNIQEIFAHNLKKLRKNRGFSQAKLAEMVNVSTHHIAMMEIARNYPALELVERIAKVLNVRVYELFIDTPSAPKEMELLYETVAKNIEQVVGEAIEKVLSEKCKSQITIS